MRLKQTALDGRWAVTGAGKIFKVTGKVDSYFVGKGLDGIPYRTMIPQVIDGKDSARLDKLAASMDLHKGGNTDQA